MKWVGSEGVAVDTLFVYLCIVHSNSVDCPDDTFHDVSVVKNPEIIFSPSSCASSRDKDFKDKRREAKSVC